MNKDYFRKVCAIKRGFRSDKEIADYLGASSAVLSQKLNGKRPMRIEEAQKWANAFDMTSEEAGKIFFEL